MHMKKHIGKNHAHVQISVTQFTLVQGSCTIITRGETVLTEPYARTLAFLKRPAREARAEQTLFHMGIKNPVFIRERTFTMDTITKLIMILHNMFRNSIVANKNIVQVTIHLANATHYHIV